MVKREVLALLASVVLAASVVGPVYADSPAGSHAAMIPATPPAPSAAAQSSPAITPGYVGPCDSPANNLHATIQRTALTFTGAKGQMTLGGGNSPASCLGSGGESLDMLATIQGYGGGTYNLAQCAVASMSGSGPYYYYTAYNDGNMYAFPAGSPRYQQGDVVTCSITATQGLTPQWTYTLTNVTAGTSKSVTSSRAGAGGDTAWWGFEVWNDYDEMGGGGSSAKHTLSQLAYQYSGSSSWFYTSGSSLQLGQGSLKSWWHPAVTQSGGYDTISAYTDAHL